MIEYRAGPAVRLEPDPTPRHQASQTLPDTLEMNKDEKIGWMVVVVIYAIGGIVLAVFVW